MNWKSVLSRNEKPTFKKQAQHSQSQNAYREVYSLTSFTCSKPDIPKLKEDCALARHPIFFPWGFQFLQIPSQKGRKEKYSFSLISGLLMEISISGPNLICIMADSLSFPRASRVSEATAVLNYCQSVISQGSWGPLASVFPSNLHFNKFLKERKDVYFLRVSLISPNRE